MKAAVIISLLAAALLSMGCDQAAVTDHSQNPAAADQGGPPGITGALFEGIWIDNAERGLVKPRPPGIGANDDIRVNVYQIAPVDPENPLSPAIELPGGITIPGRDHVFRSPAGNQGTFRAIARTVPVVLPGWFVPPMFSCDIPDLGPMEGRIAYRMQPVPHPCGLVPQLYAVDFGDDGCLVPLTSVDRVEMAAAEGHVFLDMNVPEEPWPFSVRPHANPGSGQGPNEAPACVE